MKENHRISRSLECSVRHLSCVVGVAALTLCANLLFAPAGRTAGATPPSLSLVGIKYNNSSQHNELFGIDAVTASTTLLNTFDFDSGAWYPSSLMSDIAAGNAYAVSSAKTLYTFNLATGAVQQSVAIDLGEISLGVSGKLIGLKDVSNGTWEFRSVDPTTGTTTMLSTFSLPSGYVSDSFVTDPSTGPAGTAGTAYLVSGDHKLYTFNVTTGALLGTPLLASGIGTIALGSNGQLVAIANTSTAGQFDFRSIDPSTGNSAVLNTFSLPNGYIGSSFVSYPSANVAYVVSGNDLVTFDLSAGTVIASPTLATSLIGALAVRGPQAPTITSPLSATATVGQQFTYQIVTNNPATAYSGSTLPSGLSLDTNTGVITGAPSASGSASLSIGASNSSGSDSKTLTLTINPAPPPNTPVITSGTAATGKTNSPFSFQITATGVTSAASVTATGLPANLTLNSATGLISGTPASNGSFEVNLTLTDNGNTVIGTLQLTFTSDPNFPIITSPPSAYLTPGQPFSYTVTAPGNGSSQTTFTISGPLPPGLTFDPNTGEISGTYNPGGLSRLRSPEGVSELKGPPGSVISSITITAHNSSGTATAQLLFLAPPPTAAVNLSTRAIVGIGDDVLIGGFIVVGDAPKKVIVRAIGPSLKANGQPVSGRLEDPTLALYDGKGVLIRENDDWKSNQEQAIKDSTVPPADERESAIVATLEPGNYTAQVKGKGVASGIALVELYDLDTANTARLAQISTRGNVREDDNVMIGGFIIAGDAAANVLVRAIGPELKNRHVADALDDTTLELRDANGGLLAHNDDWRTDQEQEIKATTVPPTDNRESAIVRSLSKGRYTAIVRGKGNTTGVALVEVYVLR